MSSLTPLILWHAAVGVALAAAVWTLGVGLTGRFTSALDGYAVGLLAATVAAFAYLLHPLAGAVVAAAVVVAAVAGRGAVAAAARAAWRPLAWSLAPAIAFASILGFLLHGPTEELDSAAFGDMLWYVNRLVSATQSVVPYRDLLAEGESIVYVESAPSFLSAVLLDPLGLDEVLVQTTLFPAFLLAALAIGFGLARLRPSVVAALLAAGAIAYPSWLTETPPATMAIPLVFSLYVHLVEWRPPWVVAAAGTVVGIDLLLTKVLGLIPAAAVLGAILLERSGRSGRDRLLKVALPLAFAGAAAIAVLVVTIPWQASLAEAKVLPLDAIRTLGEPGAASFAPAATVVAQALLVAALARARLWAPAAGVGAAVVGFWFAHRYNFDIAVGMGALLAALLVARDPARYRRHVPLLTAAAVAIVASAWLRELLGIRAGLALLALFVGMLAAVLARRRAAAAVAAAAAVLLVALVASEQLRLRPFKATLTTHDYDIWREVRERVPEDALVFTTLTGPRVLPYEGWHNYPSIAGRQLYLAGWYDGRLVADEEERRRRLLLNAQVYSGRRAPDALETSRSYGSFWVVRARVDPVPDGHRLVYANDVFALYRIESASTLR